MRLHRSTLALVWGRYGRVRLHRIPSQRPSRQDHRLGIGLVVGQHPLDRHAVVGEEAGRLDQEPGRGRPGLIGQELAEGDPGAVIDRRMEIVVAQAAAAGGRGPAMDPVAAAVGMRPSFLTSKWTSSPGCWRW